MRPTPAATPNGEAATMADPEAWDLADKEIKAQVFPSPSLNG